MVSTANGSHGGNPTKRRQQQQQQQQRKIQQPRLVDVLEVFAASLHPVQSESTSTMTTTMTTTMTARDWATLKARELMSNWN
jgi:hypothetical protein